MHALAAKYALYKRFCSIRICATSKARLYGATIAIMFAMLKTGRMRYET